MFTRSVYAHFVTDIITDIGFGHALGHGQGRPMNTPKPKGIHPMTETEQVTFVSGSGQLDRADHLRDRSGDLLFDGRAILLPFQGEKVLIEHSVTTTRLAWQSPPPKAFLQPGEHPVFLGLKQGIPAFASEIGSLDPHLALEQVPRQVKFVDLRSVAGALDPIDASIAATAKALLAWHSTHAFCARCGAPTQIENGGWRRACRACGGTHFPRTDPVVIMLIVRADQVLLGRQSSWPSGIHSLLAGFMEPGETIEDAVRRETKEESGIEVGRVGYIGCQPWPYPSNLMLGCVGLAESRDITVDTDELENAQWIDRSTMQTILDGGHPHIAAPRRDAIARAILTDWVNGSISMP